MSCFLLPVWRLPVFSHIFFGNNHDALQKKLEIRSGGFNILLRGTRGKRMIALRILVVDDDPEIGMLLGEMLEELGHHVCAIEETEGAAVRAAKKHKPDLMIVDVQLGAGSGIAAVEEILRGGPVPHLFMSGERLELAGMGSMLQKPFLEADLVAAIERMPGLFCKK
jgi:CheY-like chemotaxis protein